MKELPSCATCVFKVGDKCHRRPQVAVVYESDRSYPDDDRRSISYTFDHPPAESYCGDGLWRTRVGLCDFTFAYNAAVAYNADKALAKAEAALAEAGGPS